MKIINLEGVYYIPNIVSPKQYYINKYGRMRLKNT